MTNSDSLPPSYTSWTNEQLIAWAGGVGPVFQYYLGALRDANVKGKWLSCLTESDLAKLGVKRIDHIRLILSAVKDLIEAYAALETENMQDILFSVVRALALMSSHLKRAQLQRGQESEEDMAEIDHLLVKSLMNLSKIAKKAASWLGRTPFSQIPKFSSLRSVILQNVIDLNTALRSALNESCLVAFVNPMLELTRSLKNQLEEVIHDCDDSILLTPCTLEYISLRKGERDIYGFTFQTNDSNVHIIQSVDSDLKAPAFSCGRLTKDDEVVEINNQLVLGWEHNAVARLIQQSTRHLNMRIRKRPAHCTDYFFVNSRRQRTPLTSSLRPIAAEPQHSRRSDFLRNRTPKRRTQPISTSQSSTTPSTISNITAQPATANISPEEELEEPKQSTLAVRHSSASNEAKLKAPVAITRSHSQPRDGLFLPAPKPSCAPITPSRESTNSTESFNERSPVPFESACQVVATGPSPVSVETSAPAPRKNRRRPATISSIEDFSASPASPAPLNLSFNKSTKRLSCKALGKGHCQGWLWLKKTASFATKYVKRWCIFKHNTLYYYRNPADAYAEGLILLHGFTISPTSEGSRSGRYPFLVYNDWTRFVFATDNEGSRTRWMNMLGLAAIGQPACMWTTPIGGFHPGYLTASSKLATEKRSLPLPLSPTLLEPPRLHTSSGDNSRRTHVAIHRCSSSLNVPSSSEFKHQPLDSDSVENHKCYQHLYLSVSASCLVDDATVISTDEEEKENDTEELQDVSQSIQDQSPCRLMRRDAMIRRRRVRLLTDGSISPTVFLTSPPTIVPQRASDRLSMSSETVVMGTLGLAQQHLLQPHSTGTSSDGGIETGENDSRYCSLLLLRNPQRLDEETELSPPCSLSSRSESVDHASS
ncbi:unnamed protein product [Mesocestoides corti]|uniref:PH domain-containing protein n=2 Tax=Mesocestoides corti TaxID=53468 RepID=A0A0R3U2A4_MESCO|nr:unnamed protein product [Mesocestoides corti]